MSSHREAPAISQDPAADNCDVYAFVSPDKPDTVTLVATFVPLQEPAGAPNFHNFGDDVLYEISIDNDGDGTEEITYQFQFTTHITNPNTFLYNTGPIGSLDDKNWNLRQTYTVTRVDGDRRTGEATVLASNLPCPPCNVGPRSTPNYAALANAAIQTLPSGEVIFAGQRADPFFVDLGSIFDLGALRPIQHLHLISQPGDAPGVNTLNDYNIHTIAIQIPKTSLTADGSNPTDPMSATSVIGVFSAASRQMATIRDAAATPQQSGPWAQVSRMGCPLINEVIIPLGTKDTWNRNHPNGDAKLVGFYNQPELAKLLPVLYPGAFPNLAAYSKDRADLVAILLTGIPAGIVPGFQNFTGTTQADFLRLNMAIPPTMQNPSAAGLLGGDAAGYPNGRRLADNAVTISLLAVAGAALPLVDPSFKPDMAVDPKVLNDGTKADGAYLSTFPYVGVPYSGYNSTKNPGKP